MRQILASTALSILLATGIAGTAIAQQGGSIVLSPVDQEAEAQQVPTLREAFEAFAGDVRGLQTSLREARRGHTECLALAVQSAGEPGAPIQRAACDIALEADLIDWHQRTEEIFDDGALSMWMQEELIQSDLEDLAEEYRAISRALDDARAAEQLGIEAARALYTSMGPPATPEQEAQYDELAIQVELARITAGRHELGLQATAAMTDQAERLRVVLNETGWALQSIARRQQIGVAIAEARIEQARNVARFEDRGGRQALPPMLSDLGTIISDMLGVANAPRPPMAAIEPGAAPEAPPSLGLPAGGGYSFFADIFGETPAGTSNSEVTQ